MTVSKIREAALAHFSIYGYEGTSLTQIAQNVGIKKPSLYAHFKNKEEIFFSCLDYALQNDLDFFRRFIMEGRQQGAEHTLYSLLVHYEQRVINQAVAKFCLRTLYFPPYAFKKQIVNKANQRIADIGQLLYPLFEQAKARGEMRNVDMGEASEAYLCLFDGLMIELLYAGAERFHNRLRASWLIFSQGLFHHYDEQDKC